MRINYKFMAQLKIYNDIVEEEEKLWYQWWGMDAVCYKDIDTFAESIPKDDDTIDIRIFCNGGSVQEGLAIYDRLRLSGKKISTTVDGKAASMATIIMLAAPKERRYAYENATILVHNPWLPCWGLDSQLTAEKLRNASDALQMWQDKMLDIYVERCGCDRAEMQALMDKDVWITTDKAKEIGLIGSTLPPISASASENPISKYMNKMAKEDREIKVKASIVDKVLAKLGIKSLDEVDDKTTAQEPNTAPVAMTLNTSDGETITVEREEGEPQVGDKASPDGTFEMPDGKTITIKDGVITEITVKDDGGEGKSSDGTSASPSTATPNAEVVALKAQVQSLTDERDSLKTQLAKATSNARTKEDLRILNAVAMAGGADKVLGSFASNYTPVKRATVNNKAETNVREDGKNAILAKLKAYNGDDKK